MGLQHDFKQVTSKLATLLSEENYGQSQGGVYALNGLGQEFLSKAKASGITADRNDLVPNVTVLRDSVASVNDALNSVSTLSDDAVEPLLQAVSNLLVVNGVAPV
jgi:hypothetical protein|tara:strand:+ start:476 stop:790 length:315 start_codon:yes stop_codon:yes gene_type:complete